VYSRILEQLIPIYSHISSGFRGFKVRQEWGPVLEERFKNVIQCSDNREEAEKALKVN